MYTRAAIPLAGRVFAEQKGPSPLLIYFRDRVSEHKDTLEENSTRDYIDGYLKKIQQHEHNPDSSYQSKTRLDKL